MESVTFVQVGISVGVLVVFLQIAVLINSLITSRKAQRREVSFETVFATQEKVDEVREEVKAVDRKVEALDQRIVVNGEKRKADIEAKVEVSRREAREMSVELHEKINGVDTKLAKLEGQTEMINQNLVQLTSSVNRVADRQSRIGI